MTRRARPLMVMFVDLDRFKRVNDSLGHSQGDQVVREVSRRLSGALRPSDTVGRFGGDEFLVLCESIADEREAMRIAKRASEAVEAPMRIGERDLHVTASIGIALQSPSSTPVDAGAMIRDADAAMYRAKEQGPASVKVFDPDVHRVAVERLEMEIALREALARNEMVVQYQPIVSLEDWSLRGVEALVRWNRPGVGLVPPLEFIPLAEDTGMIVPLGAWVLQRAVADVLEWRAQGWAPDDMTLTVNLSPRQLAEEGFADRVRHVLQSSGLPARNLCLEITESVVMEDLDRAPPCSTR